jgi:hypothetical protein
LNVECAVYFGRLAASLEKPSKTGFIVLSKCFQILSEHATEKVIADFETCPMFC